MILIVDNYDSFTFNLYQLCASLYPKNKIKIMRNDKITLSSIIKENFSGIIISPGPGKPSEAGICISLIQALSGKIPILGICLGHQAIGEAFGGKTTQASTIMHGRSSLVFHQAIDLFATVKNPFDAARYHSLMISQKNFPSKLIIQATTHPENIIMAIRHQVHPTFGVQFHPESILTEEGNKIIANFFILVTNCIHKKVAQVF